MAQLKKHGQVKGEIKDKNDILTKFLTNILELGDQLRVRDDGTICHLDQPDKIVMLRTEKKKLCPLVVYRTDCKLKDACILNPTSEALGDDPIDKKWFYNTTNMIHTTTFSRVVESIVAQAVSVANGGTVDSPFLIEALSGIVRHADMKTADEFAKIVKAIPDFEGSLDEGVIEECGIIVSNPSPKNFVSIAKNKREKCAMLTTFLGDDKEVFKKSFGNRIRKKTWTLIERVLAEILTTDKLDGPVITSKKDLPVLPCLYGCAAAELESHGCLPEVLHV